MVMAHPGTVMVEITFGQVWVAVAIILGFALILFLLSKL